MDLARQIDIYCERVGAAFWAEPVNALTNIAFILAGLAALRAQGRRGAAGLGREALAAGLMAAGLVAFVSHTIALVWALAGNGPPAALVVPVYLASVGFVGAGLIAMPHRFAAPAPDWAVAWLAGNAVVVGIGSFLFHTFATPWAALSDSGPILMFIIGYFAVAMHRFAGLRWRDAGLATLGAVVGMVLLSWALREARALLPPDLAVYANSTSYYPACVALLLVGLWLGRARAHPAGPVLVRAAGIFAVSLVFRTMDGPLCGWIPIGTHFLWHLFNALLLWVLISALVEHGRAPPPAARAASARAA
jgi:hypothetical protein